MSGDLKVVLLCETWVPYCLSGFLIKMPPSSFFPALSLPFHYEVMPPKRCSPDVDPLDLELPRCQNCEKYISVPYKLISLRYPIVVTHNGLRH